MIPLEITKIGLSEKPSYDFAIGNTHNMFEMVSGSAYTTVVIIIFNAPLGKPGCMLRRFLPARQSLASDREFIASDKICLSNKYDHLLSLEATAGGSLTG